MPAKSKSQQRFMGMVHAAQKGEAPASAAVAKAASQMDKEDAEDYASTKHKGLPKKVKKETKVRSLIRKMVREIMKEDFAGAYPKEHRKKFDNMRRKQSEVLGYTLTGTNDIKTEIDDATIKEERDYKAEYKKYGSSTKAKKYRAELNAYNRKKGTYGNGDGKDASHKGGKIVGFEKESVNRGRAEKSRLKKEEKLKEDSLGDKFHKNIEKYRQRIEKEKEAYRKAKEVQKKRNEGKLVEAKETPVEVARRIVQNKQHEKYKGMMLDTFTASAIVQVYDAVNDANKKKLDSLKLPKLVKLVWKVMKR